MTDFKERDKFQKPGPVKQDFLNLARTIKHEFDQELSILCYGNDIEKRVKAYQNIKRIRDRYQKRFAIIADQDKKKLNEAIQKDEKRIDSQLKITPISVYFTIQGVHVPVVKEMNNQPFSLYDFFQAPYLADENIAFHAHLPEFDPHFLSEYFPEIDRADKNSLEPYQHLLVKTEQVAYDIFFKGRKGCDIDGKGKLRFLSKHMHFDIPQIEMPGNIDDIFKQIIEGAKNDKSR